MSFLSMWLIGLAVALGGMILLWLVSLPLKNSSIVDIYWGPGFLVLALVYNTLSQGFTARRIILLVLVAIWSLRLGVHILLRNKGKGEDPRYAAWRQEAGESWWWKSLFRVFILQGFLQWIISLPLLAAQFGPVRDSLSVLDVLGVVVWLIGFAFEAGGDIQLTRFKADVSNKGKVLRTGFWKYTRHPNYFGDSAQWWGYYLFALATPGGWWTIISPIVMTFFLLRVSGVVMLEKSLKETKPQYADYIKSTPAFFPWFPKKRQ